MTNAQKAFEGMLDRYFETVLAWRPVAATYAGLSDREGRLGNATRELKTEGIIPEIVTNHYLTDTDAWFLLTNAPEGLKLFERRADSFDMDNDFHTENAKFKATMRFSVGWTDPRGIYGSPGV